jgi:hypothetical protein
MNRQFDNTRSHVAELAPTTRQVGKNILKKNRNSKGITLELKTLMEAKKLFGDKGKHKG